MVSASNAELLHQPAPTAGRKAPSPVASVIQPEAPTRTKIPAWWTSRLMTVAFVIIHLLPLTLYWTGITLWDAIVCAALYFTRMFFITAGYHRYFAHRSYKLGRFLQFVMAFGGSTAVQKGVLWWASTHRRHHKYSDLENDPHSPRHGLAWSHVGWILSRDSEVTDYGKIKDFAKYPELVWLNRYYLLPAITLGAATFLVGGWSMLIGGFFLSTVLLWHGTFSINSLAHVWGARRFATADDSRNNFWLALITLGEGWHNNHHHYPSSANQGFYWWEVDVSFYVLRILERMGVVWDLRRPPERALNRKRTS